jgi:UPF0755 protein
MPTRQSRGCASTGLLLVVVLLLCISSALLGGLVALLPGAAGELGAPAPGMAAPERMMLQAFLVLQAGALDRPASRDPTPRVVEVEEGESAAAVVARLARLGVLDRPALLRAYLRYSGQDVGIQAGSYELNGSMSLRQLADALQHARADELRLTVPEGWRLEQIAEALPGSSLGFDAGAFLDAARRVPDGYSFSSQIPTGGSLEGFLFPDTYALTPTMTAQDLVTTMLDTFEVRVNDSIRDGFFDHGLSLYQGVTLASIVEREAVVPEERARIASVFLNRLSQGMRLEADPTVQYPLGRADGGGWWKAPLSVDDLANPSPYNTYLVAGLPPGPIANPGLDSLRAVADPEDTGFLYFRAACDGSGRHAFARTFDEHLGNACP